MPKKPTGELSLTFEVVREDGHHYEELRSKSASRSKIASEKKSSRFRLSDHTVL